MDTTALFIPQNNDVVVTAKYGPEIADGAGMEGQFYLKPNKNTDDSDPSVLMITSPVLANPDVTGQFMSTFDVASEDNAVPGSFWWRVDVVDTFGSRRTANCGQWMVEAA